MLLLRCLGGHYSMTVWSLSNVQVVAIDSSSVIEISIFFSGVLLRVSGLCC